MASSYLSPFFLYSISFVHVLFLMRIVVHGSSLINELSFM